MVSPLGKPFRDAPRLTHLFPTPDVLAAAKLGDIGLSGGRAETIRAFARAVCTGRINFEGVVDSDAILGSLCEIPGIGMWTAQYVAMRAWPCALFANLTPFHPLISVFCVLWT